ncbi:hypothetical protein CC1G_07770 [Coprinopsis cinerea okayama7|uniref:DUF6570 domain-containing protein n=1 Tax=Coprinopsis cinerea (strain Okayama-7 / 130 / ATCC MYA-4618 / FGSC 9003) TaxID=240176 RepID=A8NNZ0_COPC7|nr:hypothetical protein CC1G_07770 [Coprinopsis cinerea okayama7\|eukprot:XP_001835227.2 hypothetical protein CC1G_07770 [Coprinopsis cinerea okayama7\
MPLTEATRFMPAYELGRVAILHSVPRIKPTSALETALANHKCTSGCPKLFYVFKIVVQKPRVRKTKMVQPNPAGLPSYQVVLDKRYTEAHSQIPFPPKPISFKEKIKIIHDFCMDLHPSKIEEAGCCVCGQLTLKSELTPLHQDLDLSLLVNPGVCRKARSTADEPICFPEIPVLDDTCSDICRACHESLKSGKRPKYALANYMWLGNVPPELSELSFAEKILIARVRHNRCLVKVASGRARMMANAIMFASPVVKVYHALPPPRTELEEILAFIFIGSQFPTEEDFKRTPMLDYSDLFISKENLDMYPLSGVPVTVDFRRSEPGVDPTDKEPLEQSKHEDDVTQGSEEGPCPFVLKAVALNHLDAKGKTLGVGHDPAPQSMYDNVQAYPQMFPWLFPYGLGGIGHRKHSKILSEREHKRRLLLYHDKRFQLDLYFPMIAFNHEQLKSNITASFFLSNGMVASMAELLEHGDVPKLDTPEERDCYSLLDDIDHEVYA